MATTYHKHTAIVPAGLCLETDQTGSTAGFVTMRCINEEQASRPAPLYASAEAPCQCEDGLRHEPVAGTADIWTAFCKGKFLEERQASFFFWSGGRLVVSCNGEISSVGHPSPLRRELGRIATGYSRALSDYHFVYALHRHFALDVVVQGPNVAP